MHKWLLLLLISAIASIAIILRPSSIFANHWNLSVPPPSFLSRRPILPLISPQSSFTPTPSPLPTSDPKQTHIMAAINNYRKSQGLSSVSPNSQTCNFAKTRSREIATDFSHSGFHSRVNSQTLPYPNYHTVTENIARNSSYQNVVTSWINSPSHAANMRKDTPYVCVASTGDYYAYEGWKP